MTNIKYTYPAMLGHAGEMTGYAGTLQALGADILAEQGALQASWEGDTGMTYQQWQQQWNQALEELQTSYRAMASTHEQNALTMPGRDAAEGAKWA